MRLKVNQNCDYHKKTSAAFNLSKHFSEQNPHEVKSNEHEKSSKLNFGELALPLNQTISTLEKLLPRTSRKKRTQKNANISKNNVRNEIWFNLSPSLFLKSILCDENYTYLLILVGAFRGKTQTIVVTFFKTNELTDFTSFISWVELTLNVTLFLLALEIEVN